MAYSSLVPNASYGTAEFAYEYKIKMQPATLLVPQCIQLIYVQKIIDIQSGAS